MVGPTCQPCQTPLQLPEMNAPTGPFASGRFHDLVEIGSGAFGTIYRAFDMPNEHAFRSRDNRPLNLLDDGTALPLFG